MKMKYILIAAAITPILGFVTSCSDKDEPVAIVDEVKPNEIQFSTDGAQVQIGGQDVVVPISDGAGNYTVYSLNPDVADVYKGTDGNYYIKGVSNGQTEVVVADAANQFKRFPVNVFTNASIEFNQPSLSLKSNLGKWGESSEAKITLGNGKYTAESDNDNVRVSVTEDDDVNGENQATLVIRALAKYQPYTATITVKDICGFSNSFQVNVSCLTEAFSQADLDELAASTETNAYIDFHAEPDWHRNYYWSYNTNTAMSEWVNSDSDGTHTFGWWMTYNGGDSYGGHKITYPTGTQVGQEVAGNYLWQYSWWEWYTKHTIPGTVKVLRDDETATVVVWWNVDIENEYLEKGYIIKSWE